MKIRCTVEEFADLIRSCARIQKCEVGCRGCVLLNICAHSEKLGIESAAKFEVRDDG